MGSFGWQEGLLVLFLVLILFGGSRLPQLGKGLGEAMRNFKKGIRGEEEGGEENAGKNAGR